MMHLFLRRVGYAVHVLCYMVRVAPQERLTTAPELSEWMRQMWPGTSDTYLCTVIRRLARAGILESQRGFSGGYALARRAEEISFHDVVAALDDDDNTHCALTPSGQCPVEAQCNNYDGLCKLQERCVDWLAEVSIAELACGMAAEVPKRVGV